MMIFRSPYILTSDFRIFESNEFTNDSFVNKNGWTDDERRDAHERMQDRCDEVLNPWRTDKGRTKETYNGRETNQLVFGIASMNAFLISRPMFRKSSRDLSVWKLYSLLFAIKNSQVFSHEREAGVFQRFELEQMRRHANVDDIFNRQILGETRDADLLRCDKLQSTPPPSDATCCTCRRKAIATLWFSKRAVLRPSRYTRREFRSSRNRNQQC